ncbi:hypothetical protein ABZ686_02440 [Streptomyces sp. NPDC006992]|uniref:hypothetical protein n=1 Tax=Streptomyces sp. NPDC006992 TaxID=3155601 RepID=UPI0033EB5EED
MASHSATQRLWKELAALYAAAGGAERHSLTRLVKLGKDQRPPIRIGTSTINDWLCGTSVPTHKTTVRYFNVLVTYLGAHLVSSKYQKKPPEWWSNQLAAAQLEREKRRGGRPGAPKASVITPTESSSDSHRMSIDKGPTAEAAVRVALTVDRLQTQRAAASAFEKVATEVLRDARTAATERAWLPESWPGVDDALNTLDTTGPEEILDAARAIRLLLRLLPQEAACWAAIDHLTTNERTALDQVAIAVRWADGDINEHVRIAEDQAHDAMECVQRMGGGFLWVHLREGLLLEDMGSRYQRTIGETDVALREFRSLVRRLLNESERDIPNSTAAG